MANREVNDLLGYKIIDGTFVLVLSIIDGFAACFPEHSQMFMAKVHNKHLTKRSTYSLSQRKTNVNKKRPPVLPTRTI